MKRIPRKIKKAANNTKIAYDCAGLPNGWTLKKVVEAYKDTGIVFWASSAAANMAGENLNDGPRILGRKLKRIHIVDINGSDQD